MSNFINKILFEAISFKTNQNVTIGTQLFLFEDDIKVGIIDLKMRQDGFVEVMNVRLDDEYRGKGLYQKFLIELLNTFEKPILSSNQDRNEYASKVWEKLKTVNNVSVSQFEKNNTEYLLLSKKNN